MTTKLKYEGKQYFDETHTDYVRLWTIDDPESPFHRSTRTLDGLKELGVVKWY